MKKFKKFFAVLLTLAMVLGMSMTTFAAEKANINVSGLVPGAEVTYKQLVSLDEKGEWKIEVNNLGMTLEQLKAAVNDQKNASNGKINPGLDDLNLTGVTTDPATKKIAGDDGNVAFNVSAGLYAIKAVDPKNVYNYSWMVAYVGYEDGTIQDADVVAKGESNQISKAITNVAEDDNDKTVAPGDEVEYKITVAYPFFATNADNKNFVIKDKVSNGTIKANSVNVDSKYGFTTNSYADTDTLTLTLETYDSSLAKETVEITYTVVVGDVTAANPLKNVATSTINGGTATRTEVEVPTFSATVTKTDETGKEALTGATFTLYVEVPVGTEGAVTDVVTDKTVKAVVVDAAVDTTGKVVFDGLDAQKNYWVKETKAPEGYQIVEEAMPLTNNIVMKETRSTPEKQTIEGVEYTVTKVTYSADTGTGYNSVGFEDGLNFHNTNLGSLPSTGGIGTTIFTIGGCAIMIIAAGLFFASRRRSAK